MKVPRVIQAVFHDHDGNDIAHDYYVNATWLVNLLQRHGGTVIDSYIRRAIDSKRKLCVERYGTEWGRKAVKRHQTHGNAPKTNQNTKHA